MSTTAFLSGATVAGGLASSATRPACVVAGAVLRAARLSAELSRAELGAAAGIDEASIAAHEDGTQPLADLPYPALRRIEDALDEAGAAPALVADIAVGVWCDLVIAAVTNAEDVSCLLADPTAAESAFGDLLAWAIGGIRPTRYRPYTGPGSLLRPADLRVVSAAIRRLGPTWRYLVRSAA